MKVEGIANACRLRKLPYYKNSAVSNHRACWGGSEYVGEGGWGGGGVKGYKDTL
jgi:hypothetical protein